MNCTRNGIGRLTTQASAAMFVALAAAGGASAQTDTKIPLNYNAHIMSKTTEAVQGATAINADVATNQYRSIADRGYFWDPADPNSIGGSPLVGNTGITYGLFNTLGYSNTTWPNGVSGGFDGVFMGNRVLNTTLELSGSQAFSNTASFPTWAPAATISGFAYSGTTVTAATSAPHGFKVGETVLVSGIAPAALSGTFAVTAVPDSTHFSYVDVQTTSGAAQMYANNIRVTSASLSGTTLTVTCSASHGFATSDSVTLSGIASAGSPTYGYNGTYTVTVTSPTAFTVQVTNGTTGAASARMFYTFSGTSAQISSIATTTNDLSQLTVTTSVAHTLVPGNSVTIDGVNPFAYDNSYVVATVPDSTHFTVAVAPIGGMFANGVAATSIKGNGTTFTVTTDAAPATAFAVGGFVNIVGSSVAGFNGQWTIASVPNTTSFTVTSGVAGTATNRPGAMLAAGTLDRSSLDQVTTLSSPVNVDANALLGVTYMTSNGGGAFDVVATFNNGVTDTNVTTRINSPDWFSDPADVAIVAGQPVLSQKKVTHKVGAIVTQIVGDGTSAVATCNAAGGFKVGETLTISGSSNFNGPQVVTAVPTPVAISSFATAAGVVTAATSAAHGYSVGDVVTVMGTSTNGWNGTYTISAVSDATHFSYVNATTGTSTTAAVVKPQFTFASASSATDANVGMTAIDNNTASGYVSLTSPIAVAAGTATVTTTTPHGFTSGQTVVISNTTYVLPTATNGPLYGPQVITVTDPTHFTFSTTATTTGTGTMFAGANRTFRGVNNGEANQNQGWAYGQSNWGGGPNLNLTEAVIALPANVSGQNLTKLTFRNATWTTTTLTALSSNGTTATATWTDPGSFIGQTIVITGATPATFNGTYVIASKPTSTTITFACPVNATATTAGIAGRAGVGKGYSIYAATVRNGIPNQANAACATPTVVTTDPVTHIADVAASNFTSGISAPVVTADDTTAVWFSYTAPASGIIQGVFSTCTSAFDTTIAVYTSCGGTLVASNDDTVGCGTGGSSVTFNLVNNQNYRIRVAGKAGGRGTFTLHVEDVPSPANSTPATAAAAVAGTGAPGDNAGTFARGLVDGFTTIGAATDTIGVWYQRVAMASATPYSMEARTCLDGQDLALTPLPQVTGVTGVRTASPTDATVKLPLDTTLAVYAGIPTPSSTPVASNDDGCSVSSRVRWTATPGVVYYIRVGIKAAQTGDSAKYVLHVDDPIHTDLVMPIQFNWNGICHGTTTSGPLISEQTMPGPGNVSTPTIGSVHENRNDPNGFRAISDRGLLFDPNGVSTNALNYGGTVGYQGMGYSMYNTALQSDMIFLGDRSGTWPFTITPAWPVNGGTSTALAGISPLWLVNSGNYTVPQVSSMTGLNAVFGASTKIGLLYHITNVGSNPNGSTTPYPATFDVTLIFTDSSSTLVTVQGTDWFGGASSVPYSLILPTAPSGGGLEVQRILGIYRAVEHTDAGDEAPTGHLKVDEAVISTASLIAHGFDPTGKTLASITFSNPLAGNAAHNATGSGFGIYAATLRDPASFNLNFPPSGIGTVTPNQLNAGGTGKMTVTVSRGSGTPNNITSVVVDGSSIGLSPTLTLNDSGTGGDTSPNDNVWSRNVSFPVNFAPTSATLPFTVTDAQARTATGNVIFSVVAPTGTFTPNTGVFAGVTSVHAAFVFGLPNTITSVVLDGTQLGLSPTLALNDSGLNGDTPAADGTWGRNFIPAATTAPATYLIPFTVTDSSANTATGSITITIAPPSGACCTSTTGACAVVVSTSCTGTSQYNGDNTTCAAGTPSASCPITGICCTNATGACGVLYGGNCGTTATLGAGTVCSAGTPSTSCPVSQSCCNGTSGACTFIYGGACPSGTSSSGFTTCGVSTCPASGTCCDNTTGACTLVYGGNGCGTGLTGGPGTVCDGNTCPVVAVCCNITSGVCSQIYGGLCPSGTLFASGTTCEANVTCPPTGTCCNNTSGACTQVYSNNGCPTGTSSSTGTVCDANTCPVVAVCCNASTGVCVQIYGGLCPAGSNLAQGTTCDGNTTCPAAGSCCNGVTGACTLNYSGSCASPLTFNASTSCNPTPCTAGPHACENMDGSGSLPVGWTTTTSAAGAAWAIVSDQSHSPSNAVFTNDVASVSSQFLVMPAVTATGTITLDFWSYYAVEGTTTFFDGWVVEYSTDGGANWTDIGTGGWALNGYNAAAISTCCNNALAGRPAFGGSALTWTEHVGSIPAAAGQQVIIRFQMGSDSSIAGSGVWLDDICVAGIQVVAPGVCCRGSTCSTAYADAAACSAALDTVAPATVHAKFVTGSATCNTPVTIPGTLGNTTSPCCYANYNHNTTLEVQDIFDFLNDWFAGKKGALVGGNGTTGTLSVQNIFDFLNSWFAGGCS